MPHFASQNTTFTCGFDRVDFLQSRTEAGRQTFAEEAVAMLVQTRLRGYESIESEGTRSRIVYNDNGGGGTGQRVGFVLMSVADTWEKKLARLGGRYRKLVVWWKSKRRGLLVLANPSSTGTASASGRAAKAMRFCGRRDNMEGQTLPFASS